MKRSPVVPNSPVAESTPLFPLERLLILGCSQAKFVQPGLMPALQRYNGPPFQVLRRYLRLHQDDHLRIFILSAEFGLIPADQMIPNYDRRMTPARARDLQQPVAHALNQVLGNDGLEASDASSTITIVHLSKDYVPALSGLDQRTLEWLRGRIPVGGRGPKLSALHKWLYDPPKAECIISQVGIGTQRE